MNTQEVRNLIHKLGEAVGVELDPPTDREKRTPKEFFDAAVAEVTKALDAGDVELAKVKLEELTKALAHEQVGGSAPAEQNDNTTASSEQSSSESPVRDVQQATSTAYSSNGLQKALQDLLKQLDDLEKAKAKADDEDAEKGGGKDKQKKGGGEGFDGDLQKGYWPRDMAQEAVMKNVKKADEDNWGKDPWAAE